MSLPERVEIDRGANRPSITAGAPTGVDLAAAALARWYLPVVGGIALAVLTYVGTGWLTPSYEAVATVLVASPKVGEQQPAPPNIASFRALFDSNSVVRGVVAELGLDKGGDPVTAEQFRLNRLDVEEVRGTQLIRVRARLADPELAARAANDVARRAIDMNRQFGQEETVAVRDYIREQLDAARKNLDDREARLLHYKEQAQLEILKKDTDAALAERGGMLKLAIDIEAERARLARATETLGQMPKVYDLTRSIDRDPAMLEAAKASAGEHSVLSVQMKDQLINEARGTLESQVALSQAKLAGLEKQWQASTGRRLDAPEFKKLTQLYKSEIEIARLETERTLADKIYSDLALRYEQAQLQVASRSPQLQLVDAAAPPARPIAPRRVRIAGVAGLVGGLLGLSLAAFLGVRRP